MITYLFGAGASKNAVPIVSELNRSMFLLQETLAKEYKPSAEYFYIGNEPYGASAILEDFLNSFTWLIEASSSHQSVDTFAKKLFIKGEFELLKKLKTILSIYLIIIQSKGKTDVRYDTFFASILKENHLSFPKHLRILTWNYDYQLEKAYSEFSQDYRFEACQSMLNICSKNSGADNFATDTFGIVKINGTAYLGNDSKARYPFRLIQSVNEKYSIDFFEQLLKQYAKLHISSKTKNRLNPSLSFSWEDYSIHSETINNAIKATKDTEYLVVIGYSFPLFNREVDRKIIGSMKNLKGVYFQAPDADSIKERFLAIRNDVDEKSLVTIKDIYQFVFPNEL